MVDALPRELAEAQFKSASGEAALFELRIRLLAGNISQVRDSPIDINLSVVRDAILAHYQSTLTPEDNILLKKACTLRNKLLHCEFSSTRKQLDELDPKPRRGGVTQVDISGLSGKELTAKVIQATSGADVGQTVVADTKTKTLKDVFGWLHESYGANEFEEARTTFLQALAIVDRLVVA
jgi:hypothetical protein